MKNIIVTVGPACLDWSNLRITPLPHYIYRINGAYGTLEDIDRQVFILRKCVDKPVILLDLPGNKIRGQNLPFLFQRDREIIGLANKLAVGFVGLSYVRHIQDFHEGRKLVDENIEIMCKIETKQALENLKEIVSHPHAHSFLVDRGDLAAEIGIENVPAAQKTIIKMVRLYCENVFLATQFIKYMEVNAIPTIAEINDLYNTLKLDIQGIQLSEETAVGRFPQKCLDLVNSFL